MHCLMAVVPPKVCSLPSGPSGAQDNAALAGLCRQVRVPALRSGHRALLQSLPAGAL